MSSNCSSNCCFGVVSLTPGSFQEFACPVLMSTPGNLCFSGCRLAHSVIPTLCSQCGKSAFDLLYLNGKDLRYDQLSDRKSALRQLLQSRTSTSALQYADDISGSGVALYQRVCEMDLEGTVAKHKTAPYLSYHSISMWYKIKNPRYSQMAGRHELFEQERHKEPVPGWHFCDLACAEVDQ